MRTLPRFPNLPAITGWHLLLRRCLAGFPALALGALHAVTNQTAAAESVPSADWRFDEAGGSVVTDTSDNGHTGTIAGAVRGPGQTGGGLSFDGVNDYVFASDAQSGGTTGAGLDPGTRDWTVAAWIKTTSSGMVVTKMGYVGGSNPDGWAMSVSGNGTVGAVIHNISPAVACGTLLCNL